MIQTVMASTTSRTEPVVWGHCPPPIYSFEAVKRQLTGPFLVRKGYGGEWSGLLQCAGP